MTVSTVAATAVETRLKVLRLQLNWLEQEMSLLRRQISIDDQIEARSANFASLQGIWGGVNISSEDIFAARLTVPDDL